MIRRLAIGVAVLVPVAFLAARAVPLPRHDPVPSTEENTDPLPRPHRTRNEPRQRGVALGLFAEDVSFSYTPLLREIAELGASHVALVIPIYQDHVDSTELYLHTRLSPTLEAIADTIREAEHAELEVTLFPIVRLAEPRSPQEWRGTLAPADRDAWFANYGQRVGDLASLATLTGATRLVLGSELSTLDGDLVHWSKLIELIRAVYSGTLVYSANWDHYQEARLFDLVDEIGVVGYFNLREASAPSTVEALAASWRRIGREMESNLAKYDKPFVFTEIGYRSRTGSTAAPWDESPGGTADPGEQQRGFAAFREAWTTPGIYHPRLDGIYVWNWYGYGGPATTSYTPRGKPATAPVRQILLDLERP